MRVNCCPNCQEPLPGLAKYCAKCGKSLFAAERSPYYHYDENQLTLKLADRPADLKVPHFYKKVETDANMSTRPLGLHSRATPVTPVQEVPVVGNGSTPAVLQIDDQLESGDDYAIQRNATWNKTVTYRSRHLPPAPINPKPSTPLLLQEVPPREPKRVPMRLFSWISVLALIGLLLGGVFGIVMTLGRGNKLQPSQGKGVLSLQVTPPTVALGEMLTLRGSNFYPSGRVGLTRDLNIPITDSGGTSVIHADKTGSFSDTVRVDSLWGSGQHTINAEDAHSHKSASFPVTVTGQVSLRPPHLVSSTESIDLGSGDQTTNNTQMIVLSNDGGGQITWQATATESWLLISPASGKISGDQPVQVAIAGDRSNLNVGPYAAKVLFSSNAGPANLSVKMGVEPLQPEHEAVQLTPPVLTFTGTDGSLDPPGQIVTVSNPGKLPLQWSASSTTSDGSSWLTVDPQSGIVTRGNSQPVTVSVDIESLLPGFYSGSVTFTSQGPGAVQVSQQTIYVSLTIVPQCALQVAPGELTFTSVYLQQQAPAAQIVTMGVTQGCSNPLSWSTFVTMNNGGNWLSISSTSGATPASPSVNVNVTGLIPGTYSGSVTFIWSGGTQTLPVTFVMGQATTPLLATTSQAVTFNGVTGQPNPPPQFATVTNSGGGTLNWHAAAATTIGGAWLSVTPANGTLASQQSVPIKIKVALSKTLIPGTYNGVITITGTDSSNNPAAGSPQTIPVTFVVQAPCAITATPPALTFQGVIGQPRPAAQPVTIAAGGACVNALSWTATTATTPAGGTWLSAKPASGTVGLTTSSATKVGIKLAGLTAGIYSGTVTITAVDSTKQPVGAPQTITVNLTVQPQCTLQNPSQQAETFSAEPGFNPLAAQTFTVGVIGSCKGAVTVTPTVTMGNGTGWLAVSPASPTTLTSGESATFTVTATSAALALGPYTGSISLAAVDGSGITIMGSPQAVGVTLNVLTSPQLTAGPGLSFNVPTGTNSQQITIANTGGAPLNWTAALDSAAPSFITLSAGSGANLLGGTSATTSVDVNATGLAGGSSYTTSVTITAVDAITGNVVVGSPSTIAVTITISPPQMTLKMTLTSGSLAFTTTAGSNPAAQTITIQNTGGDTLSWTVGEPSESWLTVTPASGSDIAQASSTITFNVNVTGLSPGTHDATVVITPTPGTAVTVPVTLTVNGS
jgi:Viral BACON domain